jgi:hypothetical protein
MFSVTHALPPIAYRSWAWRYLAYFGGVAYGFSEAFEGQSFKAAQPAGGVP